MNCLKVTSSNHRDRNPEVEQLNSRIRSWSSSHVDSVGESANSKQSLESHDTWKRIRLQQILFKSVVQNDLDMVLRCLRHGADLSEEYTPNFQTALHESSRRGFLRMTELLLRAGSNPNVLDEKSFLPLHYACQEGHFNTVKCLLLYGSMVTIENEYGDAPVHTATRYGHAAILPLLLSVDLRRDFDRRRIPERYETQEHVDLQNANGDSCLHIAAALDRKLIVKKFLQWGANPNASNLQGLTPLQVAIEKQRLGIVKLFKSPPLIVFDRPFYTNPEEGVQLSQKDQRQQPQQQQQQQLQQTQQPFRNFEGLQRYTEEITRHKMEHEGMPRSYLGQNGSKSMSTESLSVHQQPKSLSSGLIHHQRVSSPLGSDPAGTRSRVIRNVASVGHKVWPPNPTKVVELDPQPNNVNHTNFSDYTRVNKSQSEESVLSPISSTFQNQDQRQQQQQPGEKQTTANESQEHTKGCLVEKKLDALSHDVNQRMQSLRDKYSVLERREEQLRKSVKKQKKEIQGGKVLRREKSELHVTYENSVGGGNEEEFNGNNGYQSSDEKTEFNGNRSSEETERKVTYQIPPAPKGPPSKAPPAKPPHSNKVPKSNLRDEHVVIIRNLDRSPKVVSIDEPDNNKFNNKRDLNSNKENYQDDDDDSEHPFYNTRVTEYRNGRIYIREAPTIKDYYSSRVGRVSPKIKNLQDQLRRSQYKNIHYQLYDEDV